MTDRRFFVRRLFVCIDFFLFALAEHAARISRIAPICVALGNWPQSPIIFCSHNLCDDHCAPSACVEQLFHLSVVTCARCHSLYSLG